MNRHRPTKVSFSNLPPSLNIQSNNSENWIPDIQESSYSSGFFSETFVSSSNEFYKNTSMKHVDNNEKRNCSKPLIICTGILLSLIVFAALAINIYLLVYINNTTTATTTNTTTSTTKICSIGDTSITFDNLTVSSAVPNGYYNILWTNAYVYTETVNKSGYYTGIASSPNIIYNGGGYPMTISSATGRFFSFYSVAITAAWNDNLQISIAGYKSNTIITNNTFTVQVFTVSHLTFTGYTSLDTIIFTSYGGTQNSIVNGSGIHFVMDNICLTFA